MKMVPEIESAGSYVTMRLFTDQRRHKGQDSLPGTQEGEGGLA